MSHAKDDPEKRRAASRRYYLANRERILAWARAYAATHSEQAKARGAAWRLANPEQCRASQRDYRERHRETVRALNRRQYQKHRDEYMRRSRETRARKRGADGTHTNQEWLDKCALLGNVCFYCGEAKPLTRDHNVPLVRGGSNYIDNILPACRSCNSRKHTRTAREFLGVAA